MKYIMNTEITILYNHEFINYKSITKLNKYNTNTGITL